MRLLILGIRMDRGGTERALLSFLESLPSRSYQIDLLLAQQEGALMPEIPAHVRLLPPLKNGILFSLSRQNAANVFRKLEFRGKRSFFIRHPQLLPDILRHRPGAGERLFIALMKEACQFFSEEYPGNAYDAALAFSGDRTMFYLCDRVCCQKKIAWLHFDYRYPTRDDAIYRTYFQRCHAVVSVSHACTDLLRRHFPALKNRFYTLYNPLPHQRILQMADEDLTFPDPPFSGYRLLSVMRICHQKGADLIPLILKNLREKGLSVRWYLAGDGGTKDLRRLKKEAAQYGVDDALVLLGGVDNPYPIMKSCDLFILPSRYEGMPITIEEAKLLAVPILCTDYLSAKEQLQNEALGYVCRCNIPSLTSAIFSLLTQEEMRNRLQIRLKERPLISQNTCEIFEHLLANC